VSSPDLNQKKKKNTNNNNNNNNNNNTIHTTTTTTITTFIHMDKMTDSRSVQEKRKKRNRTRRLKKKLNYSPLPAVAVRQEGLIFGEDGCLKLVRTATMGWGVVTTKDVAKGTIVLREPPLASALMVNPDTTKNLQSLLKFAGYIPKAETIYSGLVIPMMLRGLTKEWLDNFICMPIRNWDKFMVSALVDIVKVVKLANPSLSTGKIRNLATQALGVAKANTFMNTSPITGVFYATSLYDKTSLFNHSCEANAMEFNNGSVDNLDISVLSKQAIAKGSEVFICYGNARVIKVRYRRDSLKRTFDFTCECHRCLKEMAVAEIEPEIQVIRCHKIIWEIYGKAVALSGAGKTQAAYNLYCDMITQHRKDFEVADLDIRILSAYNCTLLYFQWGSYATSRRLSLESLKYLTKVIRHGVEYYKSAGIGTCQLMIAMSLTLDAIRHRLVLLETIRLKAALSQDGVGGVSSRFDEPPPEMLYFLEATQKMIFAYDQLYGHIHYKFDMDMELSYCFEGMMRSLEVCMKGFLAMPDKAEEEAKQKTPTEE